MAHLTDLGLVSVVRRPDGLFAYLVQRREEFIVLDPVPTQRDPEAADPFEERLVPLHQVPLDATSPLKSALNSWKALGQVERLDETVLFHLINVLVHSMPDESSGETPPPLTFEPEPAPFRPTAANPRAYRGTKDRPPKPKQPRRLDLCPHLASARDVNELILKLVPFQQEAGRLLNAQEVLVGKLPALVGPKGQARDVYLACLHQAGQASLLSLPPLFRRGLVFWRRGEPWNHVGRTLALYWGLELEKHAPLRRCVERLFAAPASVNLEWCELIQDQPAGLRTAFAELLLESGLCKRDCAPETRELLRKVAELVPVSSYRYTMFGLMSSLNAGADPRYLLAGAELAETCGRPPGFENAGRGGHVPLATIRALTNHANDGHLAMELWNACGKLEKFSRVLQDPAWLKLPAETTRDLLYLHANRVYDTDLDPELQQAKWGVLRQKACRLVDVVREIPDSFQAKAIRHLKRVVWYWDTPEYLEWALGEYLKLLPRICRPPFQEKGADERLLAVLTSLEEEDWEGIRDGPDPMFHAFEKACRRENDADLVASGIRFLALELSETVTEGILNDTAAVMKTAERLGGLGRSLRHDVMNQWKAHPALHDGLTELPAEKLVGLLLKHLPKELCTAIPRKFKDHLAGRAGLTPGQLERGRKGVLEALPAIRWRLLGHLCLEQVSQPLQPRSGSAKVVHAVRFYGHLDENRRALRKFLRAYFRGDADYLRRHPRNQEWLKKQRRLNLDVWLGGMEKSAVLRDGSAVRLHMELDPLEALRLGTYVGSCTGLGGSFAYSAAAVVLDLNKRVIYARNDQGTVVGRQLVAVSADEELVVFDVYPRGASDELKRLFRDYDLELVKRLGLDIYKPGKDSDSRGHVEVLLSKEWWDDGAWDLSDDETAGE